MDQFEKIIKDKLQQQEVPYETTAWNTLSKQLDQHPSLGVKPKSFPLKWVASVGIVVGVASYFMLSNQPDSPKKHAPKLVEKKESSAPTIVKIAQHNQPFAKHLKKPILDSPEEIEETPVAQTQTESSVITQINKLPFSKSFVDFSIEIPANTTIQLPVVNSSYCENEKIKLTNENETTIALISKSSGSYTLLKGNNTLTLELPAGEYAFVYTKNGKSIQDQAFTIFANQKADFLVGEDFYLNGLPVIPLVASKETYSLPWNTENESVSYTWLNESGTILSKDRNLDAHFFKKGNHLITLKVKNSHGCESSITKSIQCQANYNLMAMNTFIPTSSNAKNQTFMPYALLERNVGFTLQIIDPKNGQVIYETKNSTEPWTGIDQRTQQLVPSGVAYIWRAVLDKTEIGEPKNYQGTITRFED